MATSFKEFAFRVPRAFPIEVSIHSRMDAFPKDPFAWISYKDGNKLVEVLKGYVKTAQKSRGDADG